jgi:hypothetical protein
MPKSYAGYIAQAQRDWEAGRALDAGRLIYERIPARQRAAWAARVLEAVRELAPETPEIDRVLQIARDPAKWGEAHEAFNAVRALALEAKDPLVEAVLHLTESVAKVAYNASGGPAPFDRDAGWRVAQNLHAIISRGGDKASRLKAEAWSLLSTLRSP